MYTSSGGARPRTGDEETIMELLAHDEIAAVPDLGHRLRQLRWFRQSFAASARALSGRYRFDVTIDEEALTRAFIDWVEALEQRKRLATVNRADFIKFAGGLVLKELIRAHPAKVRLLPEEDGAAAPQILAFWPEGFLYTNYCISAVSAVHEQEFGESPELAACVDDLRTWWSFRENTLEMPSYAIAFLDRFFGQEPNWSMPDHAELRAAMAEARPDALPAS